MTDSRDPRANITPPITRRVAKRHPFESGCRLEFVDPAWAMLPKFAPARTANITEHGVRVEIPGFARKRHDHLRDILEKNGELEVRVCLARGGEVLELHGHVVWCHYEEENHGFGLSSIGVLVSLLEPETQERLRALIREISS